MVATAELKNAQEDLRAMAALDSARTVRVIVPRGSANGSTVVPRRPGLIAKGMVSSPANGDKAFTVWLFDELLNAPAGAIGMSARQHLDEAGRGWVAALPRLRDEAVARWSLELGAPYPRGACAEVVRARLPDGTEAVLKLPLGDRDTRGEAEALRRWNGDGAVRLLDATPDGAALLLARCSPGTPLLDLDEEPAMEVAAGLLERLWRATASAWPFDRAAARAAEWADSVLAEHVALGRPCEASLVAEAAACFRDLAADPEAEPVLLHADLHARNVLRHGEGWLAIDPKPLVGDRAFDVASLVRDRRPELARDPHPRRRIARRVDAVSERLGLDRSRVRAWSLAQTVELGLDALAGGLRVEGEHELAVGRALAGHLP